MAMPAVTLLSSSDYKLHNIDQDPRHLVYLLGTNAKDANNYRRLTNRRLIHDENEPNKRQTSNGRT